jgi:CubicO group peptidase (beta-lactamase class C family)
MKEALRIDAARVSDTAARLLEEHYLPGMAIGVVSGQELVYAEGFGYADIEGSQPMKPETRQRIGSITKTMVGLCAMALVEEGRLRLEDSVTERLPDVEFHGPAESLTVWHLMTHTGGIGEMPNVEDFSDPDFKLWMSDSDFPGVPEAYPNGVTIEVAPGTKWAYANHGWILLGEIMSRIEKEPIEAIVGRRVFEPLGMTDTNLLDDPHDRLSTGYHHEPSDDMRELLTRIGREVPDEETVDGHNIRGKYQYVRGRAAGATQSTIPDMAKYASALLRESKGIVRPQTFAEMVRPQWQPDARLSSWGLSFQVRPFFGRAGFGHGGGVIGGWNTYISVFPETDIAVLLHVNAMYDEFDHYVVPAVMGAALGVEHQPPPARPVDERVLETAPGVYEAPTPGPLTNFRIMNEMGRVLITASDGELQFKSRRGRWKEGVPMRAPDPSDPDLCELADGSPEPPRLTLIRDDDGVVIGLRLGRLATMRRNEEIEPW